MDQKLIRLLTGKPSRLSLPEETRMTTLGNSDDTLHRLMLRRALDGRGIGELVERTHLRLQSLEMAELARDPQAVILRTAAVVAEELEREELSQSLEQSPDASV